MPNVMVGPLNFIFEDALLNVRQEIHVDAAIASLDAQTLVNAARQAEASGVGIVYSTIIEASGREQLSPGVQKGITVLLLGDWRIYTLRTSGAFAIGDGNIVKPDGSTPFVDNAAVTYIQNLSAASTVVSGQGVDPAAFWNYPTRSLTTATTLQPSVITAIATAVWQQIDRSLAPDANDALVQAIATRLATQFDALPDVGAIAQAIRQELTPELQQLTEQWRLEGLDPNVPLVVSDAHRVAGNIQQNIDATQTSTTIQRTP